MPTIDRLKKIKFQYLKPSLNTINTNWEQKDYVSSAQSALNGLVPDTLTELNDSEMPEEFLNCKLNWEAGVADDTIVKIIKDSVYVVQDLTEANIPKREYIHSPNFGVGYVGKSYYGGIL